MKEALQLLLAEDCPDDLDGDVVGAVVLRALDHEVSAALVLPHVALHAVEAEGVAADLLAVASADVVADVAKDLRHSLLHLQLVLPLQRNWGWLIFCAFGVRSSRPGHLSLHFSEHTGDDAHRHLGGSQIHVLPIDVLHIFFQVLHLALDQRLHLLLLVPVGLELHQHH